MTDHLITHHPQAAVEAGDVTADALISIVGTADAEAQVEPSLFGGTILRMRFDDIPWSTPWRAPRDGVTYVGPTEQQVAECLAFAQSVVGPVSVHCKHGRSRSVAIVMAILTDRLGDPGRAVDLLLSQATNRIYPNPGIVRHAESLLGTAGQIEAALMAKCPDYRTWRDYWVRHGWA